MEGRFRQKEMESSHCSVVAEVNVDLTMLDFIYL